MIAADLSKQQVLDADPKARLQINFTRNLDYPGSVFHVRKSKRNSFGFFGRNCESLCTKNEGFH